MYERIVNDSLKIFSFNATSIRGKLSEFNSSFDVFSAQNAFDVISLTETWLNDSVFDQEILVNSRYNIFRRDRDLSNSTKKDGGGVLLAVDSQLPSLRRCDLETGIEILWVEIKIGVSRSVFLGTAYLPPDSDLSAVSSLDASIEKVRSVSKCNDSIVILGDFNMPDADWIYQDDVNFAVCANSSNVSRKTSEFLECIESNELRQHNVLPTCNSKPLDLVLTNDLSASVSLVENPVSSTHQALEVTVFLVCVKSSEVSIRATYNFKKADFLIILQLLACLSWNNLDHFVTVNDALSHFYDIIFAVISDCVPLVKYNASKFPHWYNSELITLVKEKEKARKRFINCGRDKCSDAYKSFCALRAEVKNMQKKCHTDYVHQVGNDIKDNPKRFWSYVNSQKNGSSLPKVMIYDNNQFSTLNDIVKAFCQYFESVFVVHNDPILPHCSALNVPTFRLPLVSPERMKAELLSLDSNTACGYDNVSALFLSKCADQLCFPLAKIFNMSVSRGEYPSLLKFNNIVPIYKRKGDKNSVTSYRPISMQPVVSKVFEKIVNKALRQHLKNLICDEQHGFCPNKSTVTNLSCYSDFISSALDDKLQVHSIYTDFQKAFDTVPHDFLLLKMSNYFGICGDDLKWFRSYLSDRYQRVVLSGQVSDWVCVPSGVPQGSILGPSLFLMYVNEIPNCFRSSNCLLYADDVKIFKNISNVNDCVQLQSDLDAFCDWCSKWKMTLNINKCFFINFSLKRSLNVSFNYSLFDSILTQVTNVCDLGVVFCSNMSFSPHIDQIVKKSYRMLGFVRRTMKDVNDANVLKVLFNAHVRSHLDYCSSIWSPKAKCSILKIERVQKRFIKHLCFVRKITYESTKYDELCAMFGLTSLETRRKITDLKLFHKILHGRVNCSHLVSAISLNLPIRRTRHTDIFTSRKRPRIAVRKNDFVPRTLNLVNSVPTVDIFYPNFSRRMLLDCVT